MLPVIKLKFVSTPVGDGGLSLMNPGEPSIIWFVDEPLFSLLTLLSKNSIAKSLHNASLFPSKYLSNIPLFAF